MHPIESKTLRLEPLTVAHAEEMFEPLSATVQPAALARGLLRVAREHGVAVFEG